MNGDRLDPPASRDAVGEFDLLAYADGFLDRDPARRDAVERHLAERPDAAARVAAFQAQNEALRRAGEDWVTAPVPERLLDAVYREPGRVAGRATIRAAAVGALVALAGVGGWLAGSRDSPDDRLTAFAAEARADHGERQDEPATLSASAAGVGAQGMAPLNWLTERITMRIHPPDLSPQGYELVSQERIALDGETAVRLGYRHGDGGMAHVYLRPRWQRLPASVERMRSRDVTVLRWLDGPLAVAVTTDRGGEASETEALVTAVREAVADTSVSRPRAPLSHDARLLEPVGIGTLEPTGPAALSDPQHDTN